MKNKEKERHTQEKIDRDDLEKMKKEKIKNEVIDLTSHGIDEDMKA